jgi:hypothetical protein
MHSNSEMPPMATKGRMEEIAEDRIRLVEMFCPSPDVIGKTTENEKPTYTTRSLLVPVAYYIALPNHHLFSQRKSNTASTESDHVNECISSANAESIFVLCSSLPLSATAATQKDLNNGRHGGIWLRG